MSTFYEHQITTNHLCLVTVSRVKRDFLPPQCPAQHDKVSNHKSTWFQFSPRYYSTCLPSGRSLSLHDHTTCIRHTLTQRVRNGKQIALTTTALNRKCHPHIGVNACNISNDSSFMGKRTLLNHLKPE